MTDGCNPAQATNRGIAAKIKGTSMFCHHHIRCGHTKNMLEPVGDFVAAIIRDNLDEIAPELRVSPKFETLCRAFDKEFSLCANYPKGWGAQFRPWMKDRYSGALLLHVERACKGRHDVIPMASLAIYWNPKRQVCSIEG